MEIPVIDYQEQDVSRKFTKALKDVGFVMLAHHPINTDLIADNDKLWEKFFHSRQKFDFDYNAEHNDGFVSLKQSETAKGYSARDIKEFYQLYPDSRCPAYLRSSSLAIFHSLANLARMLLAWVEQAVPDRIAKNFAMPLSEMVRNSPQTLLRLTHFPPLTGHEELGAMRAAPHEDINLLTLFPAAMAQGLEVQDNNGRWLEVPTSPRWVGVKVGDMLQECTQFYYPSTSQRMVNPTGVLSTQSLLSTQLFVHPHDEVRLSDRYTAGEYRRQRLIEIGLCDHDGWQRCKKPPKQTTWGPFTPGWLVS